MALDLTDMDAIRGGLHRRFGDIVDPWWQRLPAQIDHHAASWNLTAIEPVAHQGNTSLVLRCRGQDGRAAMLKLTPDRTLADAEARALSRWQSTDCVPAMWATDLAHGALLLEAIPDETPVSQSHTRVTTAEIAGLLNALHIPASAAPGGGITTLEERVDFIFDFWRRRFWSEAKPTSPVPVDLLDRGHRLARSLARSGPPSVLLHGDLHPGNVLHAGAARGLVAIDPRACTGDAAFDAADWVFWCAETPSDWQRQCRTLAAMTDVDPHRLWQWCTAFAAGLAAGSRADEAAALIALWD